MKGPVQTGLAISTVASRVVRFSAPEPHESATGLFDVQCSKLAARIAGKGYEWGMNPQSRR